MSDAPLAASRFEAWLRWVTHHPVTILVGCLALALGALVVAAYHLGVNSDTLDMLDEELPFRQTHSRLQRAFPQLNENLLAVVEAPTPEQAQLTAEELNARLAERPGLVRSVTWPAGSEFFRRQGVLFMPLEQLDELSERLIDAQPLLGQLARETHAATLLELLLELEQRESDVAFDRETLYQELNRVLAGVLERQPQRFSWQRLFSGEAGQASPAREVLVIDPILDFERVLAGRDLMQAVQGLRTELELDEGPVRLYFTGRVALRYEELQNLLAGAGLTGMLALAVVSLVMLVGFRSVSLSLIAVVNLLLGLSLTAGFAALAVGRVNPVSVAFVVLYIGLGVNYAAHYLFRYREMAQTQGAQLETVVASGRFLLRPLALSALTTALGFFAFVPTAFTGVAQLGLIASFAMLITLTLSYTAMPALLALIKPKLVVKQQLPDARWFRMQQWPLEYRKSVLVAGGILAAGASVLLPHWHFDSDPLNLRNPQSESVSTLQRLLESGEGSYRNIQILLEPGADGESLRRQVEELPSVDQAVSLASLMPQDQERKLSLLEDLPWLLGPDILTSDWRVRALEPAVLAAAAESLGQALRGADTEPGRQLGGRLRALAERLEGPDVESLTSDVNRALVGGLAFSLGRLSQGVTGAEPVTLEALPEWFRRQWIGPEGSRLIQVSPEPSADIETFSREVLTVAPERATGGPVFQVATSQAVTESLRQALFWAVLGITLVLLAALRGAAETLKVFAPLLLGGVLTAATMVLLQAPLNFANVVALPLLLGVAVDSGIHLVLRHRAGAMPEGNVLHTATARAIVFGSLITVGGFGNLLFSPHPGTASLGLMLSVGLCLMVLATLVFLPALLGRR